MADNIDVNVNVNTTAAQRNLANLNKSLQTLDNQTKKIDGTFALLKKTLAGLAVGSFLINTVRSAQAVQDLSEQTGLAVQSILGLRDAFRTNASSIEAADSALLKLTKNLSEAKNGNDDLAKTFEELGVNVYDSTQTIDEQVLKVIDGLGKVNNQADQVRLSMETMGKGAAANFAGISASARPMISANYEAAQAVKVADKAAENFETAIAELQKQILIALKPLSEFAKEINFSSKVIKELLDVIMALAVVIGTFTVIGRAGKLLAGIFGTIKEAGKSLGKTIEVLTHYYKRFTGAIDVKKPKNTLFEGITKSVGYAIAAISGLLGALGTLASFIIPDTVLSAFKTLGQAIGLVKDDAEKLRMMNEESAKEHAERTKKALEDQAKVAAKTKEQIAAIREIGTAYRDAGKEVLQNLDNELKYLQLTEREAEVAKTLDDIRKNSADTVKKLRQELDKLPAGEIARRQAILETIAVVQRDTETVLRGAAEKIKAIQDERDVIEERNRAIAFGDQIRQDTANLERMQQEIDMLGMSSEEREKLRKKLELEAGLKQRLAAIDLEAAQAGKNATQSQIDDWNRRREAAIQYYEQVGQLQTQELARQKELESSYTEGIKNALEGIAEQFKPINMAQEAISKGWGRISDAVDTFVETGKFKFSDFARSVLQDLAKMIAKAMIFKAISAALGAFGLKIPGMAAGGPVEAGKAYMVGEKGPELFVPPGSGKIIPNDKLGGKGSGPVNAPVNNTYNTYNINALDAKSVAQMFAENRKAIFGANKMAEREMSYAGAR